MTDKELIEELKTRSGSSLEEFLIYNASQVIRLAALGERLARQGLRFTLKQGTDVIGLDGYPWIRMIDPLGNEESVWSRLLVQPPASLVIFQEVMSGKAVACYLVPQEEI